MKDSTCHLRCYTREDVRNWEELKLMLSIAVSSVAYPVTTQSQPTLLKANHLLICLSWKEKPTKPYMIFL